MNYKISAIIPVLNGEKYISSAIQSILNQSYSVYEIIVVDNGSTDSTVDLVSRVSDSRVKLFSIEERGVSKARNYGISVSGGDYIAFLDADDTWTSDKIFEQIQAFNIFGPDNIGLIYSGCVNFRKKNKYVRCTLDDLVVGNIITTSGVIISKKIINQGENFFDEFSGYAEDWGAWIRVALNWDIIFVNGAYVVYQLPSPGKYSWNKVSEGLFRIIEQNEKNNVEKSKLKKIKHGVWIGLLKWAICNKKYKFIYRSVFEIIKNFSLKWYLFKINKIRYYE